MLPCTHLEDPSEKSQNGYMYSLANRVAIHADFVHHHIMGNLETDSGQMEEKANNQATDFKDIGQESSKSHSGNYNIIRQLLLTHLQIFYNSKWLT